MVNFTSQNLTPPIKYRTWYWETSILHLFSEHRVRIWFPTGGWKTFILSFHTTIKRTSKVTKKCMQTYHITSPRDFWDAIDYCYFNHRIREAMKTLRLLKTDWLMDGLEPFKILILLKKFRPLKTIVIDGLSTSRKYSSLKETKCPLLTDWLTHWQSQFLRCYRI